MHLTQWRNYSWKKGDLVQNTSQDRLKKPRVKWCWRWKGKQIFFQFSHLQFLTIFCLTWFRHYSTIVLDGGLRWMRRSGKKLVPIMADGKEISGMTGNTLKVKYFKFIFSYILSYEPRRNRETTPFICAHFKNQSTIMLNVVNMINVWTVESFLITMTWWTIVKFAGKV